MAARRITTEELEQLEQCYHRSVGCVNDLVGFVPADIELHETIAQAAGNTILERFMAGLSQLGQVSRRRTVELPSIAQQSVHDHRAIIDALQAHDPVAASQAMLTHLHHVEHELQQASHCQKPLSAWEDQPGNGLPRQWAIVERSASWR